MDWGIPQHLMLMMRHALIHWGGKILSKMENRSILKLKMRIRIRKKPTISSSWKKSTHVLKMYFRISILKNGGIFPPVLQVQLRLCSSHCHGRHSRSLFQCKHSSNHSWPQECQGAKQKWGWKMTTWSKLSGWLGRIFVENLSFLVFFWLIHSMINVDFFLFQGNGVFENYPPENILLFKYW